jgi:hypothetical protein
MTLLDARHRSNMARLGKAGRVGACQVKAGQGIERSRATEAVSFCYEHNAKGPTSRKVRPAAGRKTKVAC